jgi:hypothetical protein
MFVNLMFAGTLPQFMILNMLYVGVLGPSLVFRQCSLTAMAQATAYTYSS